MDLVSAAQTAVEGMSICIAAAKAVKTLIETIKNVGADLLELAKEIDRCRNMLGMLKVLAREAFQRGYRDVVHIDLASLRQCLNDLKELTSSIASTKQKAGKIIAGIHMATTKSEMLKLTIQLQRQKENVMDAVLMVNTFATLRTSGYVQKLKEDAEKQTTAPAFGSATLSARGPDVRTWLGNVSTENFPPGYNDARKRLSDAAYDGRWDEVFQILQEGRERYNENWINAFRIKPRHDHDKLSHWTPLHQAAFWRAPADVVERLVHQGAFRTLRSKYSEFSYLDQTPVELAKELGYTELVTILTPAIQSPVPIPTIRALEHHFHELIRSELGDKVDRDHLYLPLLEVLTELDDEAVWFEIINHEFGDAGYLFRLDGRDLVVRSHGINAKEEWKEYRITAYGTTLIQQALLINDYD